MNKKIQCLRNKMAGANLQGLIISNPVNIYYLTNINVEGTLYLTKRDNILVTDARYVESVRNTLTLFDEITVYDQKDLDKTRYYSFFENSQNIGFEENYVTYEDYEKICKKLGLEKLEKTQYLIEKERIIKDEEEISNIRKACEITDECYSYILKKIRVGMTEKEVAKLILDYYYYNSDGISFDPIVASGANSSMPHAVPTNRIISKGDIVTIDMGCKVNGYCSDMTRTFFVEELDKSYEFVYNIVRQVQKKSLSDMKDCANIKNIAFKVEQAFKMEKFSLVHALGHGVGLDIHERPTLSVNSNVNSILKENMVITSEPGIYIPGKFGVRIEDTLRVGKFGCEVLTSSPKDIIIVNN